MIRGNYENISVYLGLQGWQYQVSHSNGIDAGVAASEEEARAKAEERLAWHRAHPFAGNVQARRVEGGGR